MLNLSNKTYFIQVFGCQMNLSDAEHICGMLDELGAIQVDSIEKSDICIFVSCCVREAANVRFMGQVASMKNFEPAHDEPRITCICGCYAQLKAQEIADELKHVNIIFGTNNVALFPRYLESYMQNHRQIVETFDEMQADLCACAKTEKQEFSSWLPIMTGCNNFCTYCIVPYVRGREISRPIENIEADIKKLASRPNLKQLILLGQNVNSYGRDLYGKPRFAQVLEIAANSGIERIRFVTSHPKDLSDETIDVFAKYKNIMPQLHLPLQSGSARILKAMNRKYTPEHYLHLIEKLKSKIEDIALSTDIIIGFPGETLEDFEQTYAMVEKIKYNQVFTFLYSRREGTPAAKMFDDTPKEEIQRRFDYLVELVQKNAYEQNCKDVDKTIDVLVEGLSKRDKNTFEAKSPKNQTVHFECDSSLNLIGKIVPVKITEAKTWYLNGELI